jgi:hypothetical protein
MNSDMHNDAGHLTALGWTMFALYLAAALLAFRVAASVRSRLPAVSRQPSADSRQPSAVSRQWTLQTGRIWLWLGVVLAALGVNKPLDLQTRLIELGRQIAGKEHLLAYRAEFYALFFAGFLLAVIALLALVAFRWRGPIGRFGRQLPLAAGGCALVGAYIVVRAASITHVDLMLGFDLEQRNPFLWLLEAGGLLLIIVGALRKIKS